MTAISSLWDLSSLMKAPAMSPTDAGRQEGVHSILYDSVPYQGKRTRVFAYYALPERAARERVPAMVLVHGGGGSAFPHWVRLWADRGYAAIAMDTCGCVSGWPSGPHMPHEHAGPPGWGGFDQMDRPVEDQWTYHAVSAVIAGHSLIRSFPQVDPDRVGLTGISWGGYLTCLVAGLDPRFRFAAPVYGCGFLGDNSAWLDKFKEMGDERARRWLALWDPSVYLPRVTMPLLWVTGTNEFAYIFDSFVKTIRLVTGPRMLSVRVRMPHDHHTGMAPREIAALADSLFEGRLPLVKVGKGGSDGGLTWVPYESTLPLNGAALNYTTDDGDWKTRTWQTIPAKIDLANRQISAEVPAEARAYYFNLSDLRELVVSSEPVIV